jgi:YVTN family beta-propeller protein
MSKNCHPSRKSTKHLAIACAASGRTQWDPSPAWQFNVIQPNSTQFNHPNTSRPPAWCLLLLAGILLLPTLSPAQTPAYRIFVSDEKSGDITIINGTDFSIASTLPVGKRPRGIHASPDGQTLYVALSGTPIEPPPQLDTNGNPILQKYKKDDDDDSDIKADKAADGIAVIDLNSVKMLRKIPAGSDPEQFSLSTDGQRLYIANEDIGTATILDIATEKILTFIPVTREPEGVGNSPVGKFFYVGCETAGDIFAIDTTTFKVIGHIQVHPRPRSIDFLPDGSKAFASSESSGELNVLDPATQTLFKTIALPKGCRPMCVKVAPDGKKVYVSTGRGGTICVVDTTTYTVLANIKVGKRPWGIALSPDDKYLFAANGPSDDVSVVDLSAGKEISRVKLSPGSSPWGIAVVPQPK